jgi:antitoxin (DNA-binding transcriptional repressor) of toxin-antitoxin stability system
MRVVGVRELKAKLSAYLREVGRGEAFLVTDRDRVVAELRPPRAGAPLPSDELERSIESLVEAGELTPARRSLKNWTWRPRGLEMPEGTALELLDRLRSERGDGNEA